MKKLILLSLLLFSLPVFSAEIIGKVIGISDGDTITVWDDMDKGIFKVRLDKIDAPEKKQAFGNKSRQFLSSLIWGKKVSVRFKAVDRYGRIVGVIYLDGTEINLVMVQNGCAWHYGYFDRLCCRYGEVMLLGTILKRVCLDFITSAESGQDNRQRFSSPTCHGVGNEDGTPNFSGHCQPARG